MDKAQIITFLSDAIAKRDASANEAQMIGNFVSFLRPMFLPGSPIWVDHYISGIETKLRTRRGTTGSMDVFVDSTVIEFERDLRGSHFSIGKAQVHDYCNSLISTGHDPNKMLGVLSDTVDWYIYRLIPSVSGIGFDLQEVDKCIVTTVNDTSATQIGHLLEYYLGRKEVCKISGELLAQDFGVSSHRGTQFIRETQDFISRAKNSNPDYALMISELWDNFVAKYTSPNDVDSYLYEYYISIVAKLICANILNANALLSSTSQIIDMLKGDYFTVNYGYTNFIVYDYFGWLNDAILSDTGNFVSTIKTIQEELSLYDYSAVPDNDIFGELMSNLALNSTRILLGQEPTPQWLSDAIVQKVASTLPNGTYPHFVDMCCGSGSMIVSTITWCTNLISHISLSDDEKRKIIRECIEGIDIDPLSVLLSKINWIIHTRQFFVDADCINIPIFHADSLFIVSPVTTAPGCYDINIDGHIIHLPTVLLRYECGELLSVIIEKAVLDISTCYSPDDAKRMAEATIRPFISILTQTEIDDIIVFLAHLQSTLFELHNCNRNGIWGYLIDNGYKPAILRTKYNGIVSNTPWLALSKVKDNPYKIALSHLCDELEILPSGSASPHVELATAFLLSSIERYLESEATFGCILPHSVLNGDNHIQFRKKRSFNFSQSFDIDYNEIWDLPKATFKNRAIALFGKKHLNGTSLAISGRIYSNETSFLNHDIAVLDDLNTEIWSFEDTIYHPSGQNYQFNQGADMMPRCFYFYELSPYGTTKYHISDVASGNKYYYLRKDDKYTKYSVCTGLLSRSLFKTTIVSKALMPFCLVDRPYALLPFNRNADGEWEEYSAVEYSLLPIPQQRYLRTMKSAYFSLEDTNLYGDKKLDFREKLTKQKLIEGKYLVFYGASGANVSASYLYIDTNVRNSVIDQTVYWTMVDTEDEAIYIVGLLNSTAIANAIRPFQPEGEEGLRHIHALPPKFIPQFNSDDSMHQNIVSCTRSLLTEIGSQIQNFVDLNSGTLQSQRISSRRIIESSPSYATYEDSCSALLSSIH